MQIYFVRHGESQANLQQVISNRGLQHGLTEKGKQQARALAERLAELPVARLFSSPLLRAIQTGDILAEHLQVNLEVAPALREFDCGIMEGRSDEIAWQAWREITDAWVVHQRWEQRIEGGESFTDLRARFEPFIQGLMDRYQEAAVNLVCVGHGGLYQMMLPVVLQNLSHAHFRSQGFAYGDIILAGWQDGQLLCETNFTDH